MADAVKLAVAAGRRAYLAGRIAPRRYATASSPADGSALRVAVGPEAVGP